MCAYVYPSVRMYLSASFVRVSMLAFVCMHARVREGADVSPSVRPPLVCLSVCTCTCSCVQMFDRTCVRSPMHAFVCLYVGVCLSPSVRPSVCRSVGPSVRVSVRPSVCLSVCPRACSCVQLFVSTYVLSSMHARHFLFLTSNFLLLTSNFLLLTSNFLLLTSYFHVCTWVFASVRTCVRMSIRPCVCT